jgi:TctA family transporter
MNEPLRAALAEILSPGVLATVIVAAIYGTFVGAIPGLTATMAVALMVPVTFFLDDVTAIAAIVATVTCSIFAGDIPGVLIRIPGTPASAAYTLDGYALRQGGRQEEALGICLVFSVFGGFFGLLVLFAAAPQLARLEFTSYEYFWLCVLGLSCAAFVSHESRLKGLLALCVGLLISTVGLSVDHGRSRFTFGLDELQGGVNFIPAMIGLFGVSEVLRNALRFRETARHVEDGGESFLTRHVWRPLKATFVTALTLLVRRLVPTLRSNAIGTFVGMLPGAGADLAAWLAYAVSKRFSKQPELYGRGSIEGLADAGAANNAALGGAWIPSLVFGIPGDSVTAIALGVLMMKNVEPGPGIFKDPQGARVVYGVYLAFFMANLVLIPLGFLAIRTGSLLVRIPQRVLLPLILVFCVLGAYAIAGDEFDILVMLALGLLGFVLEGLRVPLGPVVLGIILGGQLEHRFIQSLTKSQSAADFFIRPISALLALACVMLWCWPLFVRAWRRWRRQPQ